MTQYIDIIFFAIIAVVLFFRLRNVIGETDDEIIQDKESSPTEANTTADKKPKILHVASSSAVVDALKAMTARDSSFSPADFIVSAKKAFEMIVGAYISGDRKTLKMLLSPELFAQFEMDIKRREDNSEVLHIAIQNYKKIQITDIDVRENFTRIEVTFEVEEIVYSQDLNGKLLEGSETQTETTTDIWTFEKEMESSNPTWYLVQTRTDGEEKF